MLANPTAPAPVLHATSSYSYAPGLPQHSIPALTCVSEPNARKVFPAESSGSKQTTTSPGSFVHLSRLSDWERFVRFWGYLSRIKIKRQVGVWENSVSSGVDSRPASGQAVYN